MIISKNSQGKAVMSQVKGSGVGGRSMTHCHSLHPPHISLEYHFLQLAVLSFFFKRIIFLTKGTSKIKK